MAEKIAIKDQEKLTNIYNKIIKIRKNVSAYMLVGNSRKKLFNYAILLSKILICPNSFKEECSKCNICKRIDDNSYTELKVINAENKVIKKDKVIEITRTFNKESIEGRNLVYIINNVECLNVSSSNSILKFLEEPDSNVVAIFTTTNFDRVIKTISSRCQILKTNTFFSKRGIDLVKEIIDLDEENIYKALDFIKKIENNYSYATATIKENLLNNFNNKEMVDKFLKIMLIFYKDLLNYKTIEKTIYFEKNDIKSVADKQKENIITKKISFILENIEKIEYNVNIPVSPIPGHKLYEVPNVSPYRRCRSRSQRNH